MAGGAEDVGGVELGEAGAEEMFGGGFRGGERFVEVAGEAHGGGTVEDAGAALFVRQKAELGVVLEAAKEDVVEERAEFTAIARENARGVGVDVVLEMTAEETGAVPRERTGAGLQKEADALDGAHAENELVGVEEGFGSLLGADAQGARDFVVEDEFDGVGV